MRVIHTLLSSLVLIAAIPGAAMAEIPKELRVCGDVAEWPPFTYFARENGRKTEVVAGYNRDFLDAMFAGSRHGVKIELIPWARCTAAAAQGKYDIVLDANRVQEREKDFVFPNSHYSVTPIAIYSKARPVPAMNTHADMDRLNRCTPLGWKSAGVPPPTARAVSVRSLEAAAARLRAGDCDYLLLDWEVMDGLHALGSDSLILGQEFGFRQLPWEAKSDSYLMVPRDIPYSSELVELLNRGIEQLNKSGVTAKLTRRYLSR